MSNHRAILAAKEGDLTTLEKLCIDGTLGCNITDSLGAGLVHHATRARRLECLKFLVLQAKIPGNQRANNGATPAHDAAVMGNLAELQWLIKEGGYSKQEQDTSGASPLHLAAWFGHPEAVEWLVQAGFDTATETQEGAVPAHYAAAKGHLKCLKMLIATDLSWVNKQTRSGATPLYLACQEGHLHTVEFLVKDCKADVHLRTHDGMTVLHAAACSSHYAVVVWLGTFTDVSLTAQDTEGATALHFAAREGHAAIADRLFLMGAEVVLDHWGGTPLHDAAENGHLECCQTLISHQVDPRIRDVDGYTARDLAEYNGHMQCACYLQEAEKLTQQPARLLRSNISGTSSMEKEVNGYLQKPDSSKTCNIVKLDESNKSLITELKINKSLQKVKITALLSNLDKKTQPPDATIPGKLLSMLDELGTSDIDSLVPTHDERGCSIPEWKRQVMVRKLEAHLASEEGMGMKGKECCALKVDDWQYSQAHNAILGPYGELLTGDDLLYLEKQVEKLQVKRKYQEYKSELECLTDELQTVFPNPTVNITVNHKFLEQGSEEAIQEVSAWCSHMSGVIKGTALLLSKINGMKKEGDKEKVFPKGSITKSFSGGMAKREILECGVSVKDLRSHFEKEDLEGLCNPFEFQELKTMSLQLGADGEATSPLLADTCKSKKPLVYEEYETGDVKNPSDSGISYEEVSSEATKSHASTGEASTLQKERIVMLFLSHWKKSAYAPSLKLMVKKTLDAQQSGKVGLAQVMAEVKKKQAPMQKPWMEMSKLGHLVRQRDTTKTLISHWKDIISLVPSCQIRHLNHQHTIYSPEQFLPYINGEPVEYNSLTLDLFMLGYFHILELDLSPEERKARHLLCFEVFDHLGSHQWETVCAFHKAVTDEIAAGKRSWKDSFEDIKIQFFGNSKCPPNNMEPKRSPVEKNLKLVSQTRTPNLALERQDHISGKYFELGTFDSDEICSYFDRSFAFWKEREAEIFRFDELGSLH